MLPIRKHSKNSGFTIIELLMVMTVLGVLAGLVLVNYPASQMRARDARRRSDIKQYQTSLEIYYNRNNVYPTYSGNLAAPGFCTTLGLTGCPNDPKSGNYQIRSSATQYSIWAQLEQPPSPTTYFIVCSNGRTGTHTATGGPACPLP